MRTTVVAPTYSAAPPAAIVPVAPVPTYRRRPYVYTGGEIPLGAHLETRRRPGLLAAGTVIFGLSYLSTVVLGAMWTVSSNACEAPSAPWLFVPVVGPTVAGVIYSNGRQGEYRCSTGGAELGVAVVDSILQLGGVVMFAGGLVSRRFVTFADSGRSARHIALVPTLSNRFAGLTLTVTGL